jgi:hypothetical protein
LPIDLDIEKYQIKMIFAFKKKVFFSVSSGEAYSMLRESLSELPCPQSG